MRQSNGRKLIGICGSAGAAISRNRFRLGHRHCNLAGRNWQFNAGSFRNNWAKLINFERGASTASCLSFGQIANVTWESLLFFFQYYDGQLEWVRYRMVSVDSVVRIIIYLKLLMGGSKGVGINYNSRQDSRGD